VKLTERGGGSEIEEREITKDGNVSIQRLPIDLTKTISRCEKNVNMHYPMLDRTNLP